MLTLSRRGINKLFGFEVSSIAYYQKFLSGPSWPGGDSGITFGVGYDCGYNTPAQIQADWKGLVTESVLAYMISVSGLKGSTAKSRLAAGKGCIVPIAAAQSVFEKRSIPRFARLAERAFPGLDQLLPDAQTMIVSLCFNRGTALQDTNQKEQNRLEMRKIAAAIPQKDYSAIAAALRSMKRLWDGVADYPGDKEERVNGLLIRREDEAVMVEKSNRQYDASEIVTV